MEKLSGRATLWQTGMAILLLALGSQQALAQICLSSGGADQQTGTVDGYRHELWSQDARTPACMTLGPGATFTATWGNSSTNILNYLARRGLGYDQTQKHHEIGSFYANYDVTYSPNCSGGNSYMGVYGWTYDPARSQPEDLVEWYIVENWCNWNPSMDANAQKMGELWGEYDVYRVLRTNAPSIRGNRDFMQYFSIRKNLKTVSSIGISQHFYAWEKLGMPMGNMHEVSMLVEGYQNSGSAAFNKLELFRSSEKWADSLSMVENNFNLSVGQLTSRIEFTWTPAGSTLSDVRITSSNPSVVSIGVYKGNYFLQANAAGSATITIDSLTAPRPGGVKDTASVNVAQSASSLIAQNVEFRALGTTGTEKVNLLIDGKPTGQQHTLTKEFKVYHDIVFGTGDLTVEFVNDDGEANGRDVRLDYISINGNRRETEAMAVNSARYANGTCGGGGYSEWLNCNGSVNFGRVDPAHRLAVRARGNAGGERISLLVDGQAVGTWTLGTSFQEYAVTLNRADGDINVRFENDGGTRDAVIDWVKVDNQNPRQAEHMQYNTGFYANGRCGGGQYSEWLHCNGVIGFGRISDNFN